MYGWVNIKTLTATLAKQLSNPNEAPPDLVQGFPKSDKLLATLGLAGLETLSFNLRDTADGCLIHLLVSVPESNRKGLVKLLAFEDNWSGGSVQGLINNIAALIAQIPADAKLIPGHGAVSTHEDLKKYHQILVESSKIVQDAMKAGKTLDEIKKAGLPEKFKAAGSGFIKTDVWIDTIHRSYSKK